MEIIKWEPIHELTSLRRQMDRFMESFWGREPLGTYEERFIPCIDVAETDDEILATVDIPGVDEKNIKVNLSGDNLIIKGERKEKKVMVEMSACSGSAPKNWKLTPITTTSVAKERYSYICQKL